MHIADLPPIGSHRQYLQIVQALASRKGIAQTHCSLHELETRFASEEPIGIYYGENTYGDERAYLPSGEEMGRCTNCAWQVVEMLGEGEVFGYRADHNPAVTDTEIVGCGGHDFALVGGRFVVDLWISLYAGAQPRVVYDLQAPDLFDKVRAIYGDPRCWVHFDRQTRSIHDDEQRRADAGLIIHDIAFDKAA